MPDEVGTRVRVAALADLNAKGRKVVKVGRKQIVLFKSDKGIYACNNRCPHEGYPLVEGHLTDGCILTCNWHNWKFDMDSGATLVGGDRLRRYPVEVIDGEIWLDVVDPPAETRIAAALDNLRESFRRHEYDRMAREVSRLQLAGGNPLDAVRGAFQWTYENFEFGATHALGAAPDWLAYRDTLNDEVARLVPIVEIVGHLAWDSLREPRYPYPSEARPYSAEALVAAIEAEDEAAAIGCVRGALAEGLGYEDLERPLATAALAHYQNFGHAAIYVLKAGELIERLGPVSAEPILLLLVRHLVYASREDLIPEFRAYASALEAWDSSGAMTLKAEDITRLSVAKVLPRIAAAGGDPEALYHVLLDAGAWQWLHFDLALQDRTDNSLSSNVGWLDFTHTLTFANAVHTLCRRYPELWPQGLLQIGCFLGRNAGYLDPNLNTSQWQVDDEAAFMSQGFASLLDHAQAEYIVSCHLVKILTALKAELAAAPDAAWTPTLLAAVNRFLNSPLKRKHSLRTAQQAMTFVALEG